MDIISLEPLGLYICVSACSIVAPKRVNQFECGFFIFEIRLHCGGSQLYLKKIVSVFLSYLSFTVGSNNIFDFVRY